MSDKEKKDDIIRRDFIKKGLKMVGALSITGLSAGLSGCYEFDDPIGGSSVWTGSSGATKGFVAGGRYAGGVLVSTETYSDSAGTWTVMGASLGTARARHSSFSLGTDSGFAVGGGPGYLASTEKYSDSAGTWSVTGSLGTARKFHSSFSLGTDSGFAVGGSYGGYLDSTEVYNDITGTWTVGANLGTARNQHSSFSL